MANDWLMAGGGGVRGWVWVAQKPSPLASRQNKLVHLMLKSSPRDQAKARHFWKLHLFLITSLPYSVPLMLLQVFPESTLILPINCLHLRFHFQRACLKTPTQKDEANLP